MATLRETFDLALQCHQQDELDRAETLYRSVLAQQPSHPEAHHLLGVLAHQTGRIDLALESMCRSLAMQRDNPVLLYNVAGALRDSGQSEKAVEHYRRALELRPGFLQAALNLGALLLELDQVAEAVSCYRRALELNPESVELQINLGIALEQSGNTPEAIECYRRSVAIDDGFAKGWNRLGSALRGQGDVNEAIDCYRRALEIEPRYATALNNLGQALHDRGDLDEAIRAYRQALQIAPDNYEMLVNLGAALKADGQLDEAESSYRQALLAHTGGFEAYHNLALLYQDEGRLDDALESFDRALDTQPENADVRFQRSLVLLRLGKFRDGWREYEQRWRAREGPRPRELPYARWDGSPLAGKQILVHGEQGIGDEIMFASWIPNLLSVAGRCVVTCDRRLEPLFARSFPQARVIGVHRGREDFRRFSGRSLDYHVPAGSLPQYFCDADSSSKRSPYLRADSEKIASWRARFDELGRGLKIGISWRAGGKPEEARIRSTTLAQWAAPLGEQDIHWINLQYGDCSSELAAARRQLGVEIHDWPDADPLADLDHFAAQIAALDMVVSVGNATVHMAGALGIVTWCLLPCHWGWRWPSDGQRSCWYASVRVFRQRESGDWEGLFQRVRAALDRQDIEGPV